MLRLFEGEELTIVKGETDYWLEVIQSAGYFSDEKYASLDADNKAPTTGNCRANEN